MSQASWQITGSKVDTGNDGSFESSSSSGLATVQLTASGDATRVNFYNRGVGALEVRKTTRRNGANEPAENGGWGVTVTRPPAGSQPRGARRRAT